MTSAQQSYQDGRPPCAVGSQRLCKHAQQGETGKDQHGTHTTQIGVHATFLNKIGRQVTTSNTDNCHDKVEGKNQQDTHRRVTGVAILVAEIRRCPEEEEPPNTIGHELTHNKRPRLLVFEALPERNGLLLFNIVTILHIGYITILFDIVELSLINTLVLGRFVIEPYPKAHPQEA